MRIASCQTLADGAEDRYPAELPVRRSGTAPDAFFAAIRDGDLEAVTALLSNGVSTDSALSAVGSALMLAIAFGHPAMVRCLLIYGADPDRRFRPAVDGRERNANEFANADYAERTDGEDVVPYTGYTNALCQAAAFDRTDITGYLIAAGADASGRHVERTPLDIAIQRGNRDLMWLLRLHGAQYHNAPERRD